jgi:hypothetical protein
VARTAPGTLTRSFATTFAALPSICHDDRGLGGARGHVATRRGTSEPADITHKTAQGRATPEVFVSACRPVRVPPRHNFERQANVCPAHAFLSLAMRSRYRRPRPRHAASESRGFDLAAAWNAVALPLDAGIRALAVAAARLPRAGAVGAAGEVGRARRFPGAASGRYAVVVGAAGLPRVAIGVARAPGEAAHVRRPASARHRDSGWDATQRKPPIAGSSAPLIGHTSKPPGPR